VDKSGTRTGRFRSPSPQSSTSKQTSSSACS